MVANSGPTGGNIQFTDDDLNRVRRTAKDGEILYSPGRVTVVDIQGLIARLEAAEKCVRHSPMCNEHGHGCDCGFEIWNKTKGISPYTIGHGIGIKVDPTLEPGEWRIEKPNR